MLSIYLKSDKNNAGLNTATRINTYLNISKTTSSGSNLSDVNSPYKLNNTYEITNT